MKLIILIYIYNFIYLFCHRLKLKSYINLLLFYNEKVISLNLNVEVNMKT